MSFLRLAARSCRTLTDLRCPPGGFITFRSTASYIQGQSPEPRIREYFYYIDHQGQLFLDDTKVKNFVTCFKDKQFLVFFFSRLRINQSGRYEEDFPFLSLCGRERNFLRCDDRPVVFTHLLPNPAGDQELLSYCGGAEKLSVPFQPEALYMHPVSGRVYHPGLERSGGVGLVRSSLAIELSPSFVYPPESGQSGQPTHFHSRCWTHVDVCGTASPSSIRDEDPLSPGNMAAPSTDTCGLMERSVRERVPPLLTDLYQFTMAYAYWRAGRHQEPAVFEMFFRDNPFGGGFSLFAGLNDCLLFLRSFRLTDQDVQFLRSVLPPNTDPAFFDFLRGLDCSAVTIRSLPEGSVVFARVPLMEVEGPLAVVQLLETSLLCLVNYASLVCSNAARFRLAAGHQRRLLEMGLRRAQGPDGGLTASRYTHIGGFDLTSNVQAGFLFGIPVAGTIAHSYVTSFNSLEEVWPQTLVTANGDPNPVDIISLTKGWLRRVCELMGAEPGKIREGELAAFLSYAIAYPQNFLPVIDSYSVGCSGLLNFCAVALALCELGYKPVGVRLDSGDLCRQSIEVRRVFRLCSERFSESTFNSLIIVGTNNISEESMAELNKKENEINVIGVGTHLVTCTKQPSLGCVYKLVEVRGRPRMKISEDPQKSTVAGRKAVYRLLDADGHCFLDLLCLMVEPPPKAGCTLTCYPLGGDNSSVSVTPAQVTCLRKEVFLKGQVTESLCSAAETRAKVQSSLQTLHPRHKRLQEPDSYTVALSEKLRNLVTELQKGSNSDSNFLLAN